MSVIDPMVGGFFGTVSSCYMCYGSKLVYSIYTLLPGEQAIARPCPICSDEAKQRQDRVARGKELNRLIEVKNEDRQRAEMHDMPPVRPAVDRRSGAFDMREGDRVVYEIDGRHGVAGEFLQDGDVFVSFDDGKGATVKWNNLEKER